MRRAQPTAAARRAACAVLLAALLAWPASAPAQSPQVSAYSGIGPTTQQQIGPGGKDAPGDADASGDTLPFTGLDVVLVIAAGAVLLGIGVALRRGTDPTPSDA